MKSIIFEFSNVHGQYSSCNIFSRTFINFSFLEMKLDHWHSYPISWKIKTNSEFSFFDKSLISLYYQAVYNLKWKLWNIWIRTVHLSDFEIKKNILSVDSLGKEGSMYKRLFCFVYQNGSRKLIVHCSRRQQKPSYV